jgi:hypothetical protein
MAYATVVRAAGAAADQGRFAQAARLYHAAGKRAASARAAFFAFELSRDYAAA